MFNKLKSKTLLLVLAVLSGIIILVFLLENNKGPRTIREELVRTDTSKISSIFIYPQSENKAEIKLFKKENKWMAQKGQIIAEADERNVTAILNLFSLLKPQRLASTEKSSWKDFGVNDSLGNRIKIYAGNEKVADLMIGRFSFNNQTRSSISYIRLYDEEATYSVDGFLSMIANHTFSMWRNKTVVRGEKTNLLKFTFRYPGDTGFVLEKENNRWKIGAIYTDSLATEKFLNEMTMQNSMGFVDQYTPVTNPLMTVRIEGTNMTPYTIVAFPADSVKRLVINSSLNPANYFAANDVDLDKKIFKGKSYFISHSRPEKLQKKK